MLGERDLLFLGCTLAKIAGYYAQAASDATADSRTRGKYILWGKEYPEGSGSSVKANQFLEELRALHKLIYYDTKKTF